MRKGRNYGDDGGGNISFGGLSARMSEFNAALGLRSFAKLEANLKRRRANARAMEEGLLEIEPRLRFQKIPADVVTNYKDLSVVIDAAKLGYTRDELYDFLFVRPAMGLGRFLWKKGDGFMIDGLGPDGVSARVLDVTRGVVRLQTGYLYHYAFAMLIGVALFLTWYMVGGAH